MLSLIILIIVVSFCIYKMLDEYGFFDDLTKENLFYSDSDLQRKKKIFEFNVTDKIENDKYIDDEKNDKIKEGLKNNYGNDELQNDLKGNSYKIEYEDEYEDEFKFYDDDNDFDFNDDNEFDFNEVDNDFDFDRVNNDDFELNFK